MTTPGKVGVNGWARFLIPVLLLFAMYLTMQRNANADTYYWADTAYSSKVCAPSTNYLTTGACLAGLVADNFGPRIRVRPARRLIGWRARPCFHPGRAVFST